MTSTVKIEPYFDNASAQHQQSHTPGPDIDDNDSPGQRGTIAECGLDRSQKSWNCRTIRKVRAFHARQAIESGCWHNTISEEIKQIISVDQPLED